jgi:hypothetical protein
MKSSFSSASPRRWPAGEESTGFPASVTSARICWSPGVSISSARVAEGSSPMNSGVPRVRECQRPRSVGGWSSSTSTGGLGNIAPPARSRLPLAMLSASISQLAVVPKGTVLVPMRP